MPVVQALEALAESGLENGFQLPRRRVEREQPLLVAGDEGAPVLVELEPVRPAVILHDELPIHLRRDAEDAPEGDVHEPQVALTVERRALEEALHLRALAVRVGPGGAALLAELRRHRGVDLGLDLLQRLERIEHIENRHLVSGSNLP
jgi:hypothetical protein